MRVHALLQALIVAIGLILLAYMVSVESEPGAIPLLLITAGVVRYLVARARRRSGTMKAAGAPRASPIPRRQTP